MIHKDKQDKWFSNDTSQTDRVWLGDEPKGSGTIILTKSGTGAITTTLTKSETESILSEAERIVNGDRQADYSDPVENFGRIAYIASAIMAKDITAEECCIVMIAVKLARENHKHKRDNLVDLAGYVEILNRIKESNQQKQTTKQ